jgi:hypothetical protein
MAFLIPLILIAGAGVAAYGAYQQGQAAKAQGEFESKIAARNAKMMEEEAARKRKNGDVQSDRMRREAAQLEGQQRVLFGAAGTTLSGTPSLVMEKSAEYSELDRLMMLQNVELSSAASLNAAFNERAAGASAKARGQNAYTAGLYSATGTALSGVGSAYYSYSQLKKPAGAGLSPENNATLLRY